MSDHHCLAPTDPNAEYLYCASTPAAIVFTVLFGITTALHLWQAIHYRKPFCWVVIMGSLWELVGLITRILSTFDQSKRTYFLASSPLVLLAPVWINAFVYMCLGRVMHYFLPGARVWGIRAERIAMIFVCGDIFAFCVQGAGGGISVSGDATTVQRGLWVYTGGVVLQQLFILLFFGIAVSLHNELKRTGGVQRDTDWRVLLWTLYIVLILITIRIIYRICEFSMGYINYVTTHEVFYYVFDALPMFVALVIFNIWHPAKVLVGEESEFESGGGWCGCGCGSSGRRRTRRGDYQPAVTAQEPHHADPGAHGRRPTARRVEQGAGYEMRPPYKSHPRGV